MPLSRIFLFLFLFVHFGLKSQSVVHQATFSELTIFTMPTLHPLDWSNPSSLYQSMKDCYLKTITVPDNYLLGHIAVRLESPLLSEPLYIAQASASASERIDMVLKQKVGFGILGAALKGRLEKSDELKLKLNVYAKRNKLAFIKFQISNRAAQRILDFIHQYETKTNGKYASCDFYGGAFWPRFVNEGAGCSAFGIALLDLVRILPPESKEWKVDVKIPMDIIGGEFNKNKKIKNRTIKNTKNWFKTEGINNKDYVNYFVYEPSIIYDWILKKNKFPDDKFIPVVEKGIPGLLVDRISSPLNDEEPLFIQRTDTNLFITNFRKKLEAMN